MFEAKARGASSQTRATAPGIATLPTGSNVGPSYARNVALLPPGNLPTYRRENWTEQTIQAGFQVTATGNLGRDGAWLKEYPSGVMKWDIPKGGDPIPGVSPGHDPRPR